MSMNHTHFDEAGKAIMVDVSAKEETRRVAIASGKIRMSALAFAAVQNGTVAKGDVLGVARLAGIMGHKHTAELIPLCHPLFTERASVDFVMHPQASTIEAKCTVQAFGKTGVEMEALCGVNFALLTIYDMCKALDKGMELYDIRLEKKQGGKSGHYRRAPENCDEG